MPRIGGFHSFHTARRTIRGFEAMLWLRKGFGFAGAWTVREQNQLLSVSSDFRRLTKRKTGVSTAHHAAYTPVCDKPGQNGSRGALVEAQHAFSPVSADLA